MTTKLPVLILTSDLKVGGEVCRAGEPIPAQLAEDGEAVKRLVNSNNIIAAMWPEDAQEE